jgi:hypothetical protein
MWAVFSISKTEYLKKLMGDRLFFWFFENMPKAIFRCPESFFLPKIQKFDWFLTYFSTLKM